MEEVKGTVSTSSRRWEWNTAVPELGVGLGVDGVRGGCVVVLGKGMVGFGVDGPSTRES